MANTDHSERLCVIETTTDGETWITRQAANDEGLIVHPSLTLARGAVAAIFAADLNVTRIRFVDNEGNILGQAARPSTVSGRVSAAAASRAARHS